MKTHSPLLMFLVFCALLLTNIACKKDPTKNATLPQATQEGKNTVGFMINDEVWVPYAKCGGSMAGSGSGNLCSKISARYGLPNSSENGLSFQFKRKREKVEKSSSLTINSQLGANITSTGEKIDLISVFFSDENNNEYSRLQPGSKFIITKLDTINGIISGEFEFILNEYNGSSGKQITLKNGRFDFKMNACICD